MPLNVPGPKDCVDRCYCKDQVGPREQYVCDQPCTDPEETFNKELCTCDLEIGCSTGTIGATSGGAGTTVDSYNVGRGGILVFSYQAYTVKDSFTVTGATNFSTGFISGGATVFLNLNPDYGTILVSVTGPSGTAWNYSLSKECPGESG